MAEGRRTFAVVGGGVSGLAAARLLAGLTPVAGGGPNSEPTRVVVVEQADRPGGKVATGELAGAPVELGPDQFLRRDPSAERLACQLGLGERLTAPQGGQAGLYARGALRGLPGGLVLGIPTDLEALASSGIVSPTGIEEITRGDGTDRPPFTAAELGLEDGRGDEASAGDLLRPRLGDEVVDYLVDPLLGGINAGRVDSLSLGVTAPGIARALLGRSRVLSALGSQPAGQRSDGPVFYGLAGGLGSLPGAVAAELRGSGAELWLETTASSLAASEGGYLLETSRGTLACDGIVLATPAGASSRLLSGLSPAAAAALSEIDYADVSLVTFAFEEGTFEVPPGWTGLLVPAREGKVMTAATFVSSKWPWTRRGGVELVRVSAGRYGDDRAGQLDDDELSDQLLAELSQVTGSKARVLDRLVQRWEGSFPQYRPGHRHLVESARDALPAGLALAGAALGGIGIPACISSGEAAAREVLAHSGAA